MTLSDVTGPVSKIKRHMHVQINAEGGGRVPSVAIAKTARMIAMLGLAIGFVGSARLRSRARTRLGSTRQCRNVSQSFSSGEEGFLGRRGVCGIALQ